jgi:uncharacterized protein (DUF4415 family)
MSRKAAKKRERGRPVAANPKNERVMCRFDAATYAVLRRFAEQGQEEVATCLRRIAVERLRAEGLLK